MSFDSTIALRVWSTFGAKRTRSIAISRLAMSRERMCTIASALPVTVRLAEDGQLAELVRVLAAAALARATVAICSATPLRMARVLSALGWCATVVTDAAFAARAARELPARVRLVGGDPAALAAALGGSPDVAVYGGRVTAAGRIELLPFLREQAVSITAHRFGTPDRAMIALEV
jgi:RHH-type proline utilization regulon transcriptional repressor/proline dehydrogenase/delta 1-pyrroline-5-carboxylate dehydrogenase